MIKEIEDLVKSSSFLGTASQSSRKSSASDFELIF